MIQFIECSNTTDDIYNNFGDLNPKRNSKILNLFDDMIAHINTDKNFKPLLNNYLSDAEN